MITTLHGQLPLVIYPDPDITVSPAGRAEICKVRGEALGQRINFQITLDVNTGELLLMSPDNFVGSFRIGDLVIAHVHRQISIAANERDRSGGGGNAPTH